jgi:feruloyl esterase
VVPGQWSIDYVGAVAARLGADRVESFLRLFMVPGLAHCTNRDDSQQFGQYGRTPFVGDPEYDILAALERWVESGTAPERITAATEKGGRVTEAQAVQRFDVRAIPLPKRAE